MWIGFIQNIEQILPLATHGIRAITQRIRITRLIILNIIVHSYLRQVGLKAELTLWIGFIKNIKQIFSFNSHIRAITQRIHEARTGRVETGLPVHNQRTEVALEFDGMGSRSQVHADIHGRNLNFDDLICAGSTILCIGNNYL